MKRLFRLISLIFLLGVLTACARNLPTATPTIDPNAVATIFAAATLSAVPSAASAVPNLELTQPSMAAPESTIVNQPFHWEIEFVQNGKTVPGNDNEVALSREPFTIRVKLPALLDVELNVLDKDTNFQLIHPGYIFPNDCGVVFCSEMGYAEDNKDTALLINDHGTHYWYYANENENRWSRVSFNGSNVTLEHDVAFLDKKTISETTLDKLYLVFLVNYKERQIVNDDELKKVILLFK